MDERIGAQMFTVREECKTAEAMDNTCKRLKDMGFEIVQVSGISLDAKTIKKIIDKYNLTAVTSHRSFDDFEANLDEIIEYNKTLGIDLCGIGMMPFKYTESEEALTEFINKVNVISEKLAKENMYFGYHNHAFEFAKVGGKRIIDRLIEETNPEYFNFILDTYWIQVGGCTPEEYIKKLGKRAMAIHFKDFKVDLKDWQVPKMSEVGLGNLNWSGIIEASKESGARWALIEQDGGWIDEDPFRALEISRKYLLEKGMR